MSIFGDLIKQWRAKRRLSQLALATHTGSTPRHVSFLETGRSRPSEDMILRLATALDIPFREQNMLYRAAGFHGKYRESALDEKNMVLVKQTLDRMLHCHDPYPATVLDRYWNIIDMNRASRSMFNPLIQNVPRSGKNSNILELLFHPAGARDRIVNWEMVARQLIQRVHRESFEDAEACDQIDRLRKICDLPDDWWAIDLDNITQPIIPAQVRLHTGQVISFFSMVASFGTAIDVTAQEMRIELSYPADDTSAELFAQMARD